MPLRKEKNKTLSDKIAESFAPRNFVDPENDDETTAPKLAEVDEDDFEYNNELSSFRKQNAKLLSDVSAKYRGKVSSRNEFQDSEADSDAEQTTPEEQGIENEDSDLEEYTKKLKEECLIDSEQECSEDDSETMNEDVEEENTEDEQDSYSDRPRSTEEEEDEDEEDVGDRQDEYEDKTTMFSESNQSAEIQKGFAVQNQLRIWEKLLEVRIQSQKMLIKANELPGPANFNELCDDSGELSTLAQETQQNVEGLLNKMVEMQKILTERFPETTDLLKQSKKRKSQINGNHEEPAIKRYANILHGNYGNYQPYCNSVIQKWYDRTKILTPGSSTKKGSGAAVSDFDILQKIETVLLNKSDLIKKSQTVKGNYKLFGHTTQNEVIIGNDNEGKTKEEDTQNNKEENISSGEIYDDTDFYHQQLRELIEFKNNTSSTATETSKQFAELQKLRQKMKKKVDTRASKGRKIRYVVHNKLINFMAPNPQSDWNEANNDLFSHLFQ